MSDIQRCLVICRECSARVGKPHWHACGSKAGRDAALRSHESLGHTARTVLGWPAPHVAYDRAFGKDK